jgi:hypothetical protein
MNTQKIWVADWQRERRVGLTDDAIVFQVTLTCGHCDICSRRVQRVREALTQSGANHSWVRPPAGWPEGVRCVSIVRESGTDPLGQLQRLLGLRMESALAFA